MKLRATSSGRDLRNYPLDSVDVFLLSRLEDELTPEELVDVSGCDGAETARRVAALVGFGLVEIAESSQLHPAALPPANDNAAESPAACTVPPPKNFCAEALFDKGDDPGKASEIHSERRKTWRWLRRAT